VGGKSVQKHSEEHFSLPTDFMTVRMSESLLQDKTTGSKLGFLVFPQTETLLCFCLTLNDLVI